MTPFSFSLEPSATHFSHSSLSAFHQTLSYYTRRDATLLHATLLIPLETCSSNVNLEKKQPIRWANFQTKWTERSRWKAFLPVKRDSGSRCGYFICRFFFFAATGRGWRDRGSTRSIGHQSRWTMAGEKRTAFLLRIQRRTKRHRGRSWISMGLPNDSMCTHITRQCPANNRTLEYTNSHSIRGVDRGSYRNLLCSREVATDGETG